MTIDLPEVLVTPQTTYRVAEREDLEKLYRVIIQNDDVTPMEFVVLVLRIFFDLAVDQAMDVMLTAHNEGRALVTILPFEEAQDRVYRAHSAAREANFPLTFYLEPDE